MKKFIFIILTIIICFCSQIALADSDIKVSINDKFVEFTDQKPIIMSDRTFVPVRIVSENLGALIDWDEEEEIVTITKDSVKIELEIGSNKLDVRRNKVLNEIIMDVSPVLLNGRTLLPIRYIAENLGYTVSFSEELQTVEIKTKKIIVGTNAEFPPFQYINENGKPDGFDIALMNKCSYIADFEIEYKNMDFKNLIPSLLSGEIDIIASAMMITEEREIHVDFSIPTYINGVDIILNKNNKSIKNISDLENKEVGVEQASLADFIASEDIEGAKLSRYDNPLYTILDLKAGRIDCVLMEKEAAKAYVNANSGTLYLLEAKIPTEDYGFASRKDDEILGKINESIEILKANGTYDDLVKTYIIGAFPCENCHSLNTLPIIYGLPSEEMFNDDSIILGGCEILPEAPSRYCSDCKENFGNIEFYPFNIKRENVSSVKIKYWGDDFEKTIDNPDKMEKLMAGLGYLSARETLNPQLDPRSGGLAIYFYDENDDEIDYFFFYDDWFCRINPSFSEGRYYKIPDYGKRHIYEICNELCGYPFGNYR